MPTLNEKIDAVFFCIIMGLIGTAGGSLMGFIFGIIGSIIGAVFFGVIVTIACVKLSQKELRTNSTQNKATK